MNAEGLSALSKKARGRKGDSVEKVRSCFRELEDAGYLTREYVRMGGRGYGTQLTFHDSRQAVAPSEPKPDLRHSGTIVYVVGESGSSRVKIGQTSNLEKRMSSYQTHSPVTLDLLWTHGGGLVLERILHVEFDPQRVHGEWFDFGDRDPVATIVSFVRTISAERYAEVERQMRLNRVIDGKSDFVWTSPEAAA